MQRSYMAKDAQHFQFRIKATIDEESGWWIATCKKLPGLFVTGKDKDMLQSKLVEALTLLVPRSVELGLLAPNAKSQERSAPYHYQLDRNRSPPLDKAGD